MTFHSCLHSHPSTVSNPTTSDPITAASKHSSLPSTTVLSLHQGTSILRCAASSSWRIRIEPPRLTLRTLSLCVPHIALPSGQHLASLHPCAYSRCLFCLLRRHLHSVGTVPRLTRAGHLLLAARARCCSRPASRRLASHRCCCLLVDHHKRGRRRLLPCLWTSTVRCGSGSSWFGIGTNWARKSRDVDGVFPDGDTWWKRYEEGKALTYRHVNF